MSLANEQDPETTYKVERDAGIYPVDKYFYKVTTFPEFSADFSADKLSSSPYIYGWYSLETLPQWLQDAIRALDVAGAGYGVNGLGKRVGDTYWISKVLTFTD